MMAPARDGGARCGQAGRRDGAVAWCRGQLWLCGHALEQAQAWGSGRRLSALWATELWARGEVSLWAHGPVLRQGSAGLWLTCPSIGVALVVPQWPRCPSPTARPQSGSVSVCLAQRAARSGLVAGQCFEPARARRTCICSVLLLRGGTEMEAGVVCSNSLKGTLASPKGKGAGEYALKLPPEAPKQARP